MTATPPAGHMFAAAGDTQHDAWCARPLPTLAGNTTWAAAAAAGRGVSEVSGALVAWRRAGRVVRPEGGVMHVLVGTDGSDEAVAAAVSGVGLLGTVDKVTLVCVVDHSSILMSGHESGFAGGMATDDEVAEVRRRSSDEASVALEATATAVAGVAGDAEIETRIDEGDAGPLLSALAGELDVDAVVVGSQGKGAIRRALLGSVSSNVVNNAPCPVVVVRRGTD